jgi:hypothetical protein
MISTWAASSLARRNVSEVSATGLPVGVLGRREVPHDPGDLRLLVEGRAADVAVGALDEPLTRPSGLLHRLRPGAVQVQDLGPVDQALAAEGDHVRLLAAPGRQRGGPLLGAAPFGDLLAGIDHRAVHGAGDRGRQLAGHDRHHRLVQQPQALVHLALPHHGAAVEDQRERDQVGLGDASADGGRPGRRPPRSRIVTGHHLLKGDRGEQVAALGALRLVLQQPVGPSQPTTGLRELPLVDQVEPEPEGGPPGPPTVAALGMELLGALQRPQALLDPAEEIRRRRQQLQVLSGQGGRPVGQRQRGVGVRPGQPPGRLAAPRQLSIPAQRARLPAGCLLPTR